jgi:sugar/nucleoside kinase (ribokinase family)
MSNDRILVIGAALVDVVGHYHPEQERLENKVGGVSISVGGAAFNIAANLVGHGYKCRLVTLCKSNSPITTLIRRACKSIGLEDKWIIEDGSIVDPLYVAIMKGEEFESGVTSSPIDRYIFDREKLKLAIQTADLIIVETNINAGELRFIVSLCTELGKRVCAMAVSDARVGGLLGKDFARRFELVSMNAIEAQRANIAISTDLKISSASAKSACDQLSTKSLIITGDKAGFIIITSDGRSNNFKAMLDIDIVNELGAGDALFAAACVSVLKNQPWSSKASTDRMYEWSAKVLTRPSANVAKVVIDNDNTFDLWPIIVLSLAALSVVLVTLGMIYGNLNATAFWMFLGSTGMLGGTLGSLTRDGLARARGIRSPIDWRSQAVGAVVGLVAGFLNAVPNLATQDLPYEDQSLNLITLAAFISSFLAGLAYESMLAQWGARGRDDN